VAEKRTKEVPMNPKKTCSGPKRSPASLVVLAVLAGLFCAFPMPSAAGEEQPASAPPQRGAYLGVRVEEAEREGGGARVVEVLADSPAEEAGIEEGDVIVRFGGEPIRGPIALTRRIRSARPGETVELEIVRDGESKTLRVELGERPRRWTAFGWDAPRGRPGAPDLERLERQLERLGERWPEIEKEIRRYRLPGGARAWMFRLGGRPRLGVELVETSPELREFFGAGREAGVLVGRVLRGSAAEKAGVRVGDLIVAVDGKKVRNADDVLEALEGKDGESVTLGIVRDRKRIEIEAQIPAAQREEEEEPIGPRARWLAPPPPPGLGPMPAGFSRPGLVAL